MSEGKLSVLIVDDLALMRNMIGRIIEATTDLVVGAKAINGAFALKKLDAFRPDVIVLDLEMPEMNGIEFLKVRKARNIDIPVVILSSIAKKGAAITMEALALGASDFILKPSGNRADEMHQVEAQIVETLRAYAVQYRRRHGRRIGDATGTAHVRHVAASRIRAVAIGISTGGPNTLRHLFRNIDEKTSVPIFVVQHMPAGFTKEFAASLDRISPLEVKEAETGDVAGPGRVFVSPGDRHMTVVHRRLANVIQLLDDDPVNGHRPSVDVLFESIAEVYGAGSLAIIMTGMGRDGARSIGTIKKAGGTTVGQDEQSSTVYGMPRVAADLGHIGIVSSLEAIPPLIGDLVRASN